MTYNPTFSTRISDLDRNNVVYVESLNALPTPVSNVITLEDQKEYILTKPINLGINQLQIPTGGQVRLTTTNQFLNTLTTELTGGTPLIIGDFARFLLDQFVIINSTGTANLFGANAVTTLNAVTFFTECTISGFASLGTLTKIPLGFENVVFFDCDDGLTLTDTINQLGFGCTITETNFVNQGGDHLTFTGTAGTLFFDAVVGAPTTNNRIFNFDSVTVDGTVSTGFVDFDSSNGGTTGLTQSVSSNTTLSNIIPEILADSSGGAITITLPNTSGDTFIPGRRLIIRDVGDAAGTNTITIIPNASDTTTIDGKGQHLLTKDKVGIILEYTGAEWTITNLKGIYEVLEITSNLTLTNPVEYILADTSSGNITLTLPPVADNKGRTLRIKKVEGTDNDLIIDGNGSETIDNNSSITLEETDGPAIIIISDGVMWNILSISREETMGKSSGGMYLINNTTVTTISSSGTFTQILGTALALGTLENFSFATNTLTYTGANDIKVLLCMSATVRRSVLFGGTREIKIAPYINGVQVSNTETLTRTGGRLDNLSLTTVVTLSQNDAITARVANDTNTNNLVVEFLNLTATEL